MQTGFSDAQRAVFEWILDGQFLVERADVSKIPNAKPPNGMAIISFNPETEGYLRHYYDSRGVVRVYKMTFEDGIWTLLRDAPDFTPLDFWQRFTGELSEDGDAIEGTWESSIDGLHWVHDFDLTYTKVRPM